MLAVAISNGEEVAVLEAAEVRHRDPHVLVHLVRVARREAGLRREGELGHCVRVHLLWVTRVVRERLQVRWVDRLAALLRRALACPWLGALRFALLCLRLLLLCRLRSIGRRCGLLLLCVRERTGVILRVLTNLRLGLLAHLQLVLQQLVRVFRLLIDVANVEELVARSYLVEVRLGTLLTVGRLRLHHLFVVLSLCDVLVRFRPVLLRVCAVLRGRRLLLRASAAFLRFLALSQVHLLLQEALIEASTSLLLLRGVTLASLVAACWGLVARHQWVVEFSLLADSCEAADAEHVMARLHRPVHAYELSLEPYVHDVHVDVHRVLAIWIHGLVGLRRLWLPRRPEHHIPGWTHEILLLTALAIDASLSSARRTAAADAAAHLLPLHVLLCSPSVSATALGEPVAVPHAVILRL